MGIKKSGGASFTKKWIKGSSVSEKPVGRLSPTGGSPGLELKSSLLLPE